MPQAGARRPALLRLCGETTRTTDEKKMKQRKSFLLRMDPALYEALEAWSQQELRSLNGQIEYLLKEAVAKRRKSLKEVKENKDSEN